MTTYLRPWRFDPPVLAVIFAFITTLLVLSPTDLAQESISYLSLRRITFTIALGLATYVYFRVAQRVLVRLGGNTWTFLLLAIAYSPLSLLFFRGVGTVVLPTPQLSLVIARSASFLLSIVVLTLLVSILVGRIYNRIDAQRENAEALRALAEEQRRDLLSADEKVRHQVGVILHDRFQSELVTTSLILANIAREVDPIPQHEIKGVIERLNALHSHELRDVLVALGPNLEHVDLQAALTQLAQQYEPAMNSTVTVAEGIDFHPETAPINTLLGIYRITEQALLNAVKHGNASHVVITVTLEPSRIALTVENDGRPLTPGSSSPGRGTSVVNSWCSALGGTWQLLPREGGGAVLSARIPRAGAA
jgi:signal transduction histidine kinase